MNQSQKHLIKTISISLLLSAGFIAGFCYAVRADDSLGTISTEQASRSSLVIRTPNKVHRDANGNTIRDPRPARWCGWWLRKQLGVADRSYNLARNWKHYGSPAGPDCVNCIAVYPHHVGLVTGRPAPGRIILKSGNDSNAVRERERSSRGIIAYRWPGASFASQ